ncbi:ribokinase [uncultured Proteiniphilum sp.]|uniref:ribokinase n=1 Tax=uncultured Proteiniphilum sp. TaxID=497637 RepID=UPI002639BAEA|nr:ribokinase [uncultured Proteiniphilum sp.]
MNINKIIVVGSCNTDMTIMTNRLPIPGETVLGGSFKMFSGGKGANQAVAAARLGGKVTLIAKLGSDLFGKQLIAQYENENIDIQYTFLDEELPTGVALITVDQKGENCIAVAAGANEALFPEDIDKAMNAFDDAKLLLLQLEIPIKTVDYVAKMAYKKGIKVILNPAPAASLSHELLKSLYAIIPNRVEAEILSGIKITDRKSTQIASNIIAEKGVDKVIITLGDRGAFVKDGPNYYEIPAFNVQPIDTTAAGDTFCGAFCVALSEKHSIREAVEIANKAASITVSREGAQSSIPYRDEVIPAIKKTTY